MTKPLDEKFDDLVLVAPTKDAELQARIERLEAIVVLLCQEAARGQGAMGEPFWKFIDDWRREH